jgi:hypothetical protein
MKKLIPALLLSAAVFGLVPAQAAKAETPPPAPTILLDGVPLPFPVAPIIVNSRTMVPFRAIAEGLGVDITWHQEDRSIDATGLGQQVRLVIGDNRIWINGEPQPLDVAPMIVNDRTLIPLRAFSTAFRSQVGWDQATYTATIVSPIRPMRTMAFYAISSYGERQYVPRFSDVSFGWSRLTADGHIDLQGRDFRWPEPDGNVTGDTLLADAARAGTKRYLMVYATGLDGFLANLVLDPVKRERAAAELQQVADAHGFDGVELDLEEIGDGLSGDALQQLRNGFTQLVTAVAGRMHAEGKEVLVSVHPLNGPYQAYDYARLIQQADVLSIMAHDYSPSHGPEPVDRVMEAIELALAEVGASDRHSPLRQKLMLGIVSSYETPATLPQKAGLAKRYGLAGVSLWRLGNVGADEMAALDATVSPLK